VVTEAELEVCDRVLPHGPVEVLSMREGCLVGKRGKEGRRVREVWTCAVGRAKGQAKERGKEMRTLEPVKYRMAKGISLIWYNCIGEEKGLWCTLHGPCTNNECQQIFPSP
jgi:hypothetical protein